MYRVLYDIVTLYDVSYEIYNSEILPSMVG